MSKNYTALLVAIALILIAALLLMPVPTNEKEEVAIFSFHSDWPPMMSFNDGKFIGNGPETVAMTFNSMGTKTEFRNVGSWDVVQEKVKNGEIDGIVCYKTKEREEYLVFSEPFAKDDIVLFFLKGKEFTYSQKEDLAGKSGIATIGDSYGQTLDDYIVQAKLSMIRVPTPEQAFSLLKEGKADYFIYSADAGRKTINELNLSGITESAPVSNQPFYIGLSKKSKFAKDIDKVNAALQKLGSEGKLPK